MHDVDHHHEGHEHGGHGPSELEKLRKMAQHWIGHNEDHARSYLLWAARAREAGRNEAGEILESIASEMAGHNERLRKVIELLDSGGSLD